MISPTRQWIPISVVDDPVDEMLMPRQVGASMPTWGLPPENIIIEDSEIHLWRAHLDGDAEYISRLAGTLSNTELVRAARFKFEKDQRRYMIARGILRAILGRYLSIEARDVLLDQGMYGKLKLRKLGSGPDLRFSIAHSGGLALYAFVLGHELGVDLEFIRKDVDVMRLGEHVLSEKEIEDLHELSSIDRVDGFYGAWTRKEAYLKACGLGFSMDPRRVDLPVRVGTPVEVVNLCCETQKDENWTIFDLEPAPEFAGAMIVEGVDWHLVRWSWIGRDWDR